MAIVAALSGMLIAGALAWKIFPFFYSGSEKWRTAPVAYFFNRLTVTVIAGFVGGIFASSMVGQKPGSASEPAPAIQSATPTPAVPATPGGNTEPPRAESSALPLPPERPPLTSAPTPSAETVSGQRDAKNEQKAVAAEQNTSLTADISEINCERRTAAYQELVCNDPPLRQQEDRILRDLKAKLVAKPSSEVAIEIRSKFVAFRERLNNCILKNCVENTYAEFEKQLLK